MKDKLKGLIVGILIGALAVPTAFATVGTVTKELLYENIKITMNGEALNPTDANGTYVEPFIIDGTTYLPVRAIANAMGLDVLWDDTTKTVALGHNLGGGADSGATGGATQVGTVIFDEAGLKVTYKGIREENYGYFIDFLFENNSPEPAGFSLSDVSVNDFMVYSSTSTSAEPGKKAVFEMFIGKDTLEDNGTPVMEKIDINATGFPQNWSKTYEKQIVIRP